MKKHMSSPVLRLLLVVLPPVALALGCSKSEGPGPAEKAGKAVDKAAVDATDKAKEVATAISEEAKKAADATKEAAHKAADAINTAVPTPKKKK